MPRSVRHVGPNMPTSPQIAPNSPSYWIHLFSPLFFLLCVGRLTAPQPSRTSVPPGPAQQSSLPCSPPWTSPPARKPSWYVRQLSGCPLRSMCSIECPTRFFCDLFAEKAMNSDASSDDEYGPIELDKRIKAKCFDWSDSDE